jgi:protease-4
MVFLSSKHGYNQVYANTLTKRIVVKVEERLNVTRRLTGWLQTINPIRALRRAALALANWRRRFAKLDYIILVLPSSMPALPEPRNWLQKRIRGAPPLSLWELDKLFEQIGDDPRPKGVILHLRGFQMSLADLQTLRGSILRLRQRGKRIICFAQFYDLATYFVASVGDEIVLQPGGEVITLGLRQDVVFLKDALDMLGVTLDVVAISPYKGALDQFSRSDISPEGRQQLEWLLDSRYEQILSGIAEGRKFPLDAARGLIDGAPYLDEAALEAGYVDAVLTEEGLARRLNTEHLVPWQQARKMLFSKAEKPSGQYVALLRIAGLMVPGESGSPPGNIPIPLPFIGGERAGDLTVVRQVRGLMQNKRAAAVILFIDSGGGASMAAEAMTSALAELAKDRPLLVYMNGVAASGGYYVATPARWIVAQPGTITGSIGVVTAKPVTNGFWGKLHVNRVEFSRGVNATLYSDIAPFTESQRARVYQSIEHIYRQFVDHVARGRKLTPEAVDAVSQGRVWTGVQAREHGLVDELGDVRAALDKARQLANLPDHAPLVIMQGKGKPLAAQLAEQVEPAASLRYLYANLQAICSGASQMLLPLWWENIS